MAGERIRRTHVTSLGIVGDRAWALRKDDNTRSAKKYPGLMSLRASYNSEPKAGQAAPAPQIEFEDNRMLAADAPNAGAILSDFVGDAVSVSPVAPETDLDFYRRREPRTIEESRAILGLEEGEPFPDTSGFPASVAEFATPPGTFFDCFPLLVMTTSSLEALQAIAPESNIDVRRFRPNILIESSESGFIENAWRDRMLRIGEVELKLTVPCPRCVMTTIGFHDLPRDTKIMRHLVKACQQELGIYAEVSVPGTIAEGDRVQLS